MRSWLSHDHPSFTSGFVAEGDQEPGFPQAERFRLEGQIALGGMSTSYKAWDYALDKYIALKVPTVSDPFVELQLRREARIAQRLHHPLIVRVHDIVNVRGAACLSMEFIEGRTLAEFLAANGPVDALTACRFVKDICCGLQAAHDLGIVHCDLKPANLMLDGDRLRIIDFGRAIEIGTYAAMRSEGGTPAYMSPEQIQTLPVDHRTDFYSLGLILFELLNGRLPTSAEIECIQAGNFELPTPDTPHYLRDILSKSLQTRPDNRPRNAREILDAISGSGKNRKSDGALGIKMPSPACRMACCFVILTCFLLFLRSSRTLGSAKQDTHLPRTIVLFPMRSDRNPDLQPYADAIDDYLSEAFAQFSGVRVWTAGPTIDPTCSIVSRADLAITGEISRKGEYLNVHLTAVHGSTRRFAFEITVSGKAMFAVQNRLWNKLTSESELIRFTRGSKEPLDYSQRRTESDIQYLQANSVIKRSRAVKDLGKAVNSLNRLLLSDRECVLCYARKIAAETTLYDLSHDATWLRAAFTDIRQAEGAPELSIPVMLATAQAYARAGRRKEAIIILRSAGDREDRSSDLLRLLGSILAQDGLYPEAIAELHKAVQRNPLDTRALNTLGATQLLLPDYPGAIASFNQILKLDPAHPFARVNLASAYLRSARFRDAANVLEDDLKRHPCAGSYSNLGMALFYLNQEKKALTLFEKAAEMEPSSEVFVGNLGHAYRWMGASVKARATYEKAIQLALQEAKSSPSSQVLSDLGLYYAALGNSALYDLSFTRARAENPLDLDVLYKEAVASSLLGINGRSIDLLKTLCQRGYPLALADCNPDLSAIQRSPEFAVIKRAARP